MSGIDKSRYFQRGVLRTGWVLNRSFPVFEAIPVFSRFRDLVTLHGHQQRRTPLEFSSEVQPISDLLLALSPLWHVAALNRCLHVSVHYTAGLC
jgi:hypothetical protein